MVGGGGRSIGSGNQFAQMNDGGVVSYLVQGNPFLEAGVKFAFQFAPFVKVDILVRIHVLEIRFVFGFFAVVQALVFANASKDVVHEPARDSIADVGQADIFPFVDRGRV